MEVKHPIRHFESFLRAAAYQRASSGMNIKGGDVYFDWGVFAFNNLYLVYT